MVAEEVEEAPGPARIGEVDGLHVPVAEVGHHVPTAGRVHQAAAKRARDDVRLGQMSNLFVHRIDLVPTILKWSLILGCLISINHSPNW